MKVNKEKEEEESGVFERIIKGESGGPLLEEALLIGIGTVLFIVIVNIVSEITTWLKETSKNLPYLLVVINRLRD